MMVKDLSKDLTALSNDKLLKMRDVANDNYLEAKIEMAKAEQYLYQIFGEIDRRRMLEGQRQA
ncbi:hypothetical protein KASHIRA_02730 [Serratia phage vB_SmaM-Kashira]|nr:hypothetical protein [Acinetobacter phage ABPH49]URC22847.1 hypothetical protein KASHIRA_02730 [Serratia phage vB_SmaM-Kashira]